MDIPALQESLNRLSKKQRTGEEKTTEMLDSLISELLEAKARIEEGAASQDPAFSHKRVLAELSAKFPEKVVMQQVNELQKEVTAAAGKMAKVLDRAAPADISKVYRNVPVAWEALSLEILRHLYREGLFEVGDCYAKEAGVTGAEELKSRYQKLHNIVGQLKSKNIQPALEWATEHRLEIMLKGGGVNLEFGLHKLQFLHVLTQQGKAAALQYARAHFGQFAGSHMADIQRLMGAMLWGDRLEDSPYADLLGLLQWGSMATQFLAEYFSVNGESARSPLECVLSAGGQAMPMLLKLATLMSAKPGEWQRMGQLPVEIELGREFQFHSIFACPVSREQSSTDNPPMLLPCCHVLCKLSILKLAKGSSRPFKCPYCPMETTPSSCRPIQF
jgi:hypothetical protein